MDGRRPMTRFPPEKNSALISEVKKFPALYDTSDPNRYNLGERNKAWLQVATNFNEPVELCHLRWRGLRKRYAKERRKIHEVLQGQRKPWPLFPKMSFLAAALTKPRLLSQKKQSAEYNKQIPFDGPDDDMLILDANDEVVRTCKSVDMSEEDEYIYETLDDPDSALEIMKNNPVPKSKPTAIRSGGSGSLLTCRGRSGRIRKITPKMQNSFIAKKLKQAQEIVQASDVNGKSQDTQLKKADIKPRSVQKEHCSTLHKALTESKQNENKRSTPEVEDKNNRHVATVTPSYVRVESLNNFQEIQKPQIQPPSPKPAISETTPNTSEANQPFKVVKLKGRNPIIFSPEHFNDIQNFFKSQASPNNEEQINPKPAIKVKSVDNLNQNVSPDHTKNECDENRSNLDIIHSVGLMRKNSSKPTGKKTSGGRQYSWNKSSTAKKVKRRDSSINPHLEKIQPDSQTKDYEIEETWNDIKQEIPDDETTLSTPPDEEYSRALDESVIHRQQVEPLVQGSMLHKVNEAKLELISFQRKLLEEQHRRSMEYMKKEHDMKMTLLKAEIDLKRKQLNIML